MPVTKLDAYEYTLLPGVIRIGITGVTDPILVDILSEIEQSGGLIYVEGSYYKYMDEYRINPKKDDAYLELNVVEVK